MRELLYALLAAAWALPLQGCLSCPSSEDWLAVGFRTPEQTFRTFQTGLRAGLPDLEYRCLGSDFKGRSEGLTQLTYREFRSELFRAQPWLKLAARARVVAVSDLAPDRRRLLARVSFLWHRETFAVDFVREDYFELWIDGRRVGDELVPWSQICQERDGRLAASVPLPGPLDPGGSRELRIGQEWKIDGFPLLEDPDP